jgi:hypothetical protein
MVILSARFVFLEKRLLLPLVLLALAFAGGIKLHGHLHLKRQRDWHAERNSRVQDMNQRLQDEKSELQEMMARIRVEQGMSGLSAATAFTDQANAVYNQLHDRGELLASKEVLLWEKELELEETRKLVTARAMLETEMAQYINILAHDLVTLGHPVPSGLARRPYVSLDVARRIAGTAAGSDLHSPQFSFLLRPEAKPRSAPTSEDEENLAAEGALMLQGAVAEEGLALLSKRAGVALRRHV